MKRLATVVTLTASLLLGSLALIAAPATSLAAGKGHNTAPSFNVLGFGINQLFVAKGTTVKSASMCDAIVGADSPIGPPQQVYLTVFVKANAIPNAAPVQLKDTLPYGYDEVSSPTFTQPTPFSKVYGKGSFAVGSPPVSSEGLYYEPIVSFASEAGQYEGPSSDEFDGEYIYTAKVKVKGRTLQSSAKVSIDCPSTR